MRWRDVYKRQGAIDVVEREAAQQAERGERVEPGAVPTRERRCDRRENGRDLTCDRQQVRMDGTWDPKRESIPEHPAIDAEQERMVVHAIGRRFVRDHDAGSITIPSRARKDASGSFQ